MENEFIHEWMKNNFTTYTNKEIQKTFIEILWKPSKSKWSKFQLIETEIRD